MPTLEFTGKKAVANLHDRMAAPTLELLPSESLLEDGQEPSLEQNLLVEETTFKPFVRYARRTGQGCLYLHRSTLQPRGRGVDHNDNLSQPQFESWLDEIVGEHAQSASSHDKWCCMMYPRLHLLRLLLGTTGFYLSPSTKRRSITFG